MSPKPHNLHWTESVDSTNTWAADEAAAGTPAFSWFAAETQRAGQGRLGRQWLSPPQGNLYASCVLRPRLPVSDAPQLGLIAALAAARTLRAFGTPVRIKWPNDLQLNGKKIAGILCELQADAENIDAVIVGIGINIAMQAEDFPPALRDTATSLAAEGYHTTPQTVLPQLAANLEEMVTRLEAEGFAPFRDEWNQSDALQGRRIRVLFGTESAAGVVEGLDENGYLMLRHAGGVERIVAGDVTVEK